MNTYRNSIARFALAMMIALMLASSVAASSTITMRASVRLPADQREVRLSDIALIEGEAAERYGDVIVARLDNAAGVLEISVREVRNTLEEAGVHWGRVNLNGRSVVVRPTRSGTAAPLAMAPLAIEGAPQHETPRQNKPEPESAASIRDERTLRGAIADYLIHNLHVAPDDLRLSFDRRQDDLLQTAEGDYRFEIEPVSGLRSARVDLVVRFWRDGRVEHRETISVSPLVRMPIVALARDVSRGSTIGESDVKVEHKWLSPNTPGLVTGASNAVGRLAAIRLREGEMLREQHVRRETLIRRGDQVIVRCIVGNTVIALQAEARDNGSKDDTIEFRKFGERETFLATITGPNEAVVDLRR